MVSQHACLSHVSVVFYYNDVFQADLSHPLTTLCWKQCDYLPYHCEGRVHIQCVLLHGRLIVGNCLKPAVHVSPVDQITNDLTTAWNMYHVPAHLFALVIYQSKLTVIGGDDQAHHATNMLWVSDDDEGQSWELSLPPMPTKRRAPMAVTVGSSEGEALIVAGGLSEDNDRMDKVEVLIEGQWSSVNSLSLPRRLRCVNWNIHNKRVYLMSIDYDQDEYFHCDVDSIQSAITSRHSSDCGSIWSGVKSPFKLACPTTYQQQLVAFGNATRHDHFNQCRVYLYAPVSQKWVHVGQVPIQFCSGSVVLPSGDFIVISSDVPGLGTFLKLSIKGTV